MHQNSKNWFSKIIGRLRDNELKPHCDEVNSYREFRLLNIPLKKTTEIGEIDQPFR